jgi:acetyl esterase/lipase
VPLDPHVRRLLGTLALGGRRAGGLDGRRQAFRTLMRFAETGAHVAATEERTLPGGLPIRLYTPAPAAPGRSPGLVFLHSGGFVSGDLDTHDPVCRALAAEAGCVVIAVDYRLAPEHPYPAATEDALAATAWVLDHADELGLDPARIGIGGDSAGATLAAVACQRLQRARPGALALQLLLCPILDWSAEAADGRDFSHTFLLDQEMIAHDLACYLPAGQDARDPGVSPLRAADLGGQPPAFIHTAEFDPLRGDGAAYAARLGAAGVAVRHTCHPGMVHLFHGLGRVVPYARAALGGIGADLRTALA